MVVKSARKITSIARLARQAHRLSHELGQDHDLAVLRARIPATRGIPRARLRRIVRRIDRWRLAPSHFEYALFFVRDEVHRDSSEPGLSGAKQVTIRCPSCESDVPDNGRFCSECGVAVRSPSITPTVVGPRPAPVSDFHSSDSASGGRFVSGTLLAGRYRIVGLLGKGGMGEVYRADDLKLAQAVALKFLPESIAANPAALTRLHNEVRMARQVSHPNVCRVYDAGEEAGLHFLSMEYVDGEDLSSLLRRIGRLPRDKAVETARQLCAGLAAAHERGVLHRDMKPANVMLDGRGKVRITDFGLAGLADQIGRDARSGTPAYMAPEQRAGKEVTVRSDIYALGLVLYEIFTGKHALESAAPAGRSRASGDSTPTSPSSLVEGFDPVVERVILRCLENDPRNRPATALAVAAALPGGDPLAAALAAGETPSPEMVAAAGEVGGLRPAVAWTCLGGVLLGLLVVVLTAAKTRLIDVIGLGKSPEILAERAREVVVKLGYEDVPTDTAYGFTSYGTLLNYFEDHDASPGRWRSLSGKLPPAVSFWYRASPRYMVPVTLAWGNATVSTEDPPRTLSGMVFLYLDPSGRLGYFERIPPQHDVSTGPWPDPDWGALLRESGWDVATLKPVRPEWNPLVDCDTRAAWETTFPSDPPVPLRIEAGGYHGKPVYLDTWGPWDRPYRMEEYKPGTWEKTGQYISFAWVLVLVFGGALLARRNLRLGRGDRRGGFRLAAFLFLTSMVWWLLRVRHVPDSQAELSLFFSGLGSALFDSAIFWMVYLALEPLVRKIWPDTLISWSRILSGRLRDPLVGRDLLVGAVFGTLAPAVLGPLGSALDHWLGFPPAPPNTSLDALLGVRDVAARFFQALRFGPLFPLIFVFFLVLLRVLLRKPWLAAGGTFLLFGALFTLGSRTHYPSSFLGVLLSAVTLVMLVRFGLLAAAVGWFVLDLMNFLRIPAKLSARSGDREHPFRGFRSPHRSEATLV